MYASRILIFHARRAIWLALSPSWDATYSLLLPILVIGLNIFSTSQFSCADVHRFLLMCLFHLMAIFTYWHTHIQYLAKLLSRLDIILPCSHLHNVMTMLNYKRDCQLHFPCKFFFVLFLTVIVFPSVICRSMCSRWRTISVMVLWQNLLLLPKQLLFLFNRHRNGMELYSWMIK